MRRPPFAPRPLLAGLTLAAGLLLGASPVLAMGTGAETIATLRLGTADFGLSSLTPEFSFVRNFDIEIDLAGPLEPGGTYKNPSVREVRYLVRGQLSTNPPTPSGFPAFLLNRFESGEGVISAEDWVMQSSRFALKVKSGADLSDGLQLSDLAPFDPMGTILEINAREFERTDRARYHPPQLLLFADGTGVLRNSNNSSGKTGTTNPGTGLEVDVDFGEEYITRIAFDPEAITIVDQPGGLPVPEPGTALLFGLGLAGLTIKRRAASGSALESSRDVRSCDAGDSVRAVNSRSRRRSWSSDRMRVWLLFVGLRSERLDL